MLIRLLIHFRDDGGQPVTEERVVMQDGARQALTLQRNDRGVYALPKPVEAPLVPVLEPFRRL